jgi:hypothetical protein
MERSDQKISISDDLLLEQLDCYFLNKIKWQWLSKEVFGTSI